MRTVIGIAVGIVLSVVCMATVDAAPPPYVETVIKKGQLQPDETAKLSKRNQAMLKMASATQAKREAAKNAQGDKGK